MLDIRRASDRGHARHGWLDSYHSFSFADYHDPRHMGFGPLRVINEDRVQPGMGFGTHGHRDMEIVTYVLSGRLEHKDSMGTGSIIAPGDVQSMSAGRGVRHSEYNPSASEGTHFLQIWIEPDVTGIEPRYQQTHFADDAKRGRLRVVASPDGEDGSVVIRQNARVYAALVAGEESVAHALAPGRRAYVHIVRGAAQVNGTPLAAGDAAKITGESSVRVDHGDDAEILLFDLP
jgi:redox-sensitive bicupin YhaK (pirin superfamily)